MPDFTKTIYFEPAGRIHSSQWDLINFPPEGYRFLNTQSRIHHRLPLERFIYFKGTQAFDKVVPLNLVAGLYRSYLRRSPAADLIYAYNHPVFGNRPYVVFVEWVQTLIGRNLKNFVRYRRVIERNLSSRNCKAIITWCEPAKRSIETCLNTSHFKDKIQVVPLAVRPKTLNRIRKDDVLRLLFVGSVDAWEDFVLKGGIEVLHAFRRATKHHRKLELVIRASVPPSVREEFSGEHNIRFINYVLDWRELEELYASSDVFVQPTHDTPFGAFLHAMSYGLPVITRDAFTNSELVKDGNTGFLLKTSRRINYVWGEGDANLVQIGSTPKRNEFVKLVSIPDLDIIKGIEDKIVQLADHPDLLRRMSENARQEVEMGRFSIKRRNQILKTIFDVAATT